MGQAPDDNKQETEDSKSADDMLRLTSDIDAVQDFIASIVLGMVMDVLTLAGMLAVMLWLNWRFTAIVLVTAPVMFVFVFRLTRQIREAAREVKRKSCAGRWAPRRSRKRGRPRRCLKWLHRRKAPWRAPSFCRKLPCIFGCRDRRLSRITSLMRRGCGVKRRRGSQPSPLPCPRRPRPRARRRRGAGCP